MLIVVGIGAAAFMLAMSRVVTAEAARVLELHKVQVEAMKIRNGYARAILLQRSEAGRGSGGQGEPIVVSPIDELGEVEIIEGAPRRAA